MVGAGETNVSDVCAEGRVQSAECLWPGADVQERFSSMMKCGTMQQEQSPSRHGTRDRLNKDTSVQQREGGQKGVYIPRSGRTAGCANAATGVGCRSALIRAQPRWRSLMFDLDLGTYGTGALQQIFPCRRPDGY
jgi:hypothetical protein